jgi:LysR family glycine cleavage system transcriptional activator
VVSPRRLKTETPYSLIYPERSSQLPGFRRFRDWLIAEAALSAPDPGPHV